MDSIGDILYVVVLIIAFVISAFRKAQKNKQSSPLPNEHIPPSSNPMDEDEPFIDDLRELFKPQTPKPVPEPEPIKVKPKPQPVFQQAVQKKKPSKPIKLVELEDEEQGFEFNKDEVDLRKAVIYSEILNRPYQ